MTKMDKEYIEREYEQAIKEYNTALTEDDMDNARRTMKRLEAIAMQDYGFDYADELAFFPLLSYLSCQSIYLCIFSEQFF